MTNRLRFTLPALHAIRAAKPGTRAYYNDDGERGLQLIVTDTGAKAFYLYLRFRGRPKRFRIAGFPDISPERARALATKMRAEVAEGRDPTAERQRQKVQGVTLREAFEAFRKVRRKLKPRTLHDYERFLETVFSDWLDRAFIEITREKIATRHAEITEGKRRVEHSRHKPPFPAHADNAMRALRSILNFAMVQFEGPDGERPMIENPVAKLSQTRAWNRVARRTTVISQQQLRPWFQAVLDLKRLRPTGQDAMVADYLLIVILTGLRRSEAAALTWDDVDFKGRTFTLPGATTKNREAHTLPLSDFLVELLQQRKRINGEGPFVFPGNSARRRQGARPGPGHLVEPRPEMRRVTAASGVPFTLHDLRRTFATVAESLDIPAYALKRLLNHKMRQDVTAGYLIITPERLREPMQRITDYFLKAGGVRESAKVVRLKVQGKA